MKKLLSSLLLFAFLFASCSKSDTSIVQMIPATAETVIIVNAESLSKKLNESTRQQLSEQFETLVGRSNLSTEQMQLVKELLKDPTKSGLSIDDKLFFYKADEIIGLAAKVADRAKLEELLKSLEIASESDYETKNGVTILITEASSVAVWDDTRLLFVFDEYKNVDDIKNKMLAQLTQKEEESISNEKIFRMTNDKCKDLSLFQKVSTSQLGTLMNFTFAVNSSFEKGYYEADINIFYQNNEKLLLNGFRKIEGKHSKYHKGADLILQTSINTESLLNDMKQMGQSNPMLNGIISQIEGDITVILRTGGRYDVLVSVKDEKETKELFDGLLSMFLTVKKDGENKYIVNTPEGAATILIENKIMHLSLDKGNPRNDVLSELKVEKNAIFLMQGNSQIITELSGEEEFAKVVEAYKLVFKNDSTAHARIDFVDKSTNSLNVIISKILENKDKARRFIY